MCPQYPAPQPTARQAVRCRIRHWRLGRQGTVFPPQRALRAIAARTVQHTGGLHEIAFVRGHNRGIRQGNDFLGPAAVGQRLIVGAKRQIIRHIRPP